MPLNRTEIGTPLFSRALFACCSLLVCVVGLLYLGFLDREPGFDEVGLYNAAYMFQHYGRITYPVHGHFDDMVIHPPVHYLVIGILMRHGWTLLHASALEPTIFLIVVCLLLLFSRFPIPIRFGLLFGTFLGALIWVPIYIVRPDLSLALAWTAGLIALESGRLADWSPWRLALGSILLVYTSAVHYPGIIAQSGILVYAGWAAIRLRGRRRLTAITALTAGPILVGIPYLWLFAVPFRNQILATISQHQGGGGVLEAFHHHMLSYGIWLHYWHYFSSFQPLVQSLLLPFWYLRIPVAIIGPVLFFAFRSTRVLAIAASPQVLFVLFAARHKQPGYPGYFAPEAILYLAGIISLFFAGTLRLGMKVDSRVLRQSIGLILVAGFTWLVLHDKPSSTGVPVKFSKQVDDLDVGRAAGRSVLGPNAFVGVTGAGVWYTSGAEHLYSVNPDFLFTTVAGFRPQKFFSQFDAVVLDNDQTWATWNKERVNVMSFFASGDLNVKGFWFDDRRLNVSSGLTWLALTVRQDLVRGYAMRYHKTYAFEPETGGDSVFLCAVCPIADLKNTKPFDFYQTFYLPSANNDDPRGDITDPNDPRKVMRVLLVSNEQFQHDVLPNAARCQFRYQIAGRLTAVDQNAMLQDLKRNDRPIKFYRSLAGALGATGKLNPENTTRVPDAIHLETLRSADPAARVSKSAQGYQVVTTRGMGAPEAVLPISHVDGVSSGYVYMRARERNGTVGISLWNTRAWARTANEVLWESHDPVNEIYIPIESLDATDELIIRNMQAGAASEILIEDAAVVIRR